MHLLKMEWRTLIMRNTLKTAVKIIPYLAILVRQFYSRQWIFHAVHITYNME